MAKISIPLITVLIFAFIASFALLHSGLPPTHDGEYHIVRFIEFDRILRAGNLYPRWAPDLNYGYGIPLFNYVYPLPNYFSSVLHVFGISFIDAFKLNFFVSIIFAGIFFYKWTKIFFGEKGAAVGAVFYMFSPYMFVDTYIRGSVGEVWALALFPAFLWSITELVHKDKKIFFSISIIFLALVIFSHNILALMFFPFSVFYSSILIYSSKNKKENLINYFLVILVGLCLSSIFWLPALSETKYTVGLQIFDYKSNFPDLYQLLFPSWGSGFFGGIMENQMSVQIGVANLIVVIVSIIVLIKLFRKKDYRTKLLGFFLISFFIILFLMLRFSLPLWGKVPLMNYFQFPWRFLSLTILISSFLAASIFSLVKNKIIFTLFLFLPFILAFNYAHPAYYMQRSDNYYATKPNFIDGTNSIGNSFNTLWFSAKQKRVNEKIQKNDLIAVSSLSINPVSYKFNTSSTVSANLTVNTAYFPGWSADIDGRGVRVNKSSEGLITFQVPEGKHSVRIDFRDTFVRQISSVITLASVLLVITLLLKNWYINR